MIGLPKGRSIIAGNYVPFKLTADKNVSFTFQKLGTCESLTHVAYFCRSCEIKEVGLRENTCHVGYLPSN